jgi:glycosyltransferase involved in cell wall biosynthesis
MSGAEDRPQAVMLTTDTDVDRRIHLEASALRCAGWDVVLLAPQSSKGGDGTRSAMPSTHNFGAAVYRALRTQLPLGEAALGTLREFAWRYVVSQERFYETMFAQGWNGLLPDIVIAHDLPTLAPARTAAQRFGAGLIYDSHELFAEQELPDAEKLRWSKIEARHIASCDAVITVNQSIAAELQRRYGIADVRVIYNAEVSANAQSVRDRHFHRTFGLPHEALILLMQGTLSIGRNIETLVLAMEHVINPAIHLVIMGDGPAKSGLIAHSSANGTVSRVHFHERVSQSDLISFTAAASAGVIPYQATSLNNYYCTPNKLFEFIAAGLPICSSDLPEIQRIVDENAIGKVGDLSTPVKAAEVINEFFADAERLAAWSLNARETRGRVNWEIEGARFVAIVEEVRLRRTQAARWSSPR